MYFAKPHGTVTRIPHPWGKLDFGLRKQTYYCELDGLRRKHLLVKIIGE